MATITPAINPNKLNGLGKWLVKTALPFVIAGLEDLFTDGVGQAAPVDDVVWRRLTWRFTRATPAGTTEDFAVFGFDVVNLTGGNLDSSWTAGDYTAVDAAVNELWLALRPLMASSHTLVEVQYHARSFNPDLPIGELVPKMITDPITGKIREVPRFARSGPPLHILPINAAGTGPGVNSPYQTAMSVTMRTAAPRHWGRCYLPGVQQSELAGNGRFAQASCQTVANAFAECASDLAANDFYFTVASTQQTGKYATALQSVKELVVDDIPDVIRRRRPAQASSRSVGVATP